MSRSLPGRPDLDRLRLEARELWDAARAGRPAALNRFASHVGEPVTADVTLAQAQWVIAREHGFASWSRLKATTAARTHELADAVAAFLEASVTGRLGRAARLLAAEPRIATADLASAAVLGELSRVQASVLADPKRALRPDTRRGWPPLLYVCHSGWHRADPRRAEGLLQVTYLLLDAGAPADTVVGGRSALFGATAVADHAAVAALLLRHGADADDRAGRPGAMLRRAATHRDPACLRLLLDHRARITGTNALATAVRASNTAAARFLLDHGADPGREGQGGALPDGSERSLPLAAQVGDPELVAVLVDAGADPDTCGVDLRSSVRGAVRSGHTEAARLLVRRGAHDDSTEVDRFLGACLRGDRTTALRMLSKSADLTRRLTGDDLAVFVDAAARAEPAAVRLLVDLGFPVSARNADGVTPLHAAARAGRSDLVGLLLAVGADPHARDGRWGSTPLVWASVASGEPAGLPSGIGPGGVVGDWAGAARVLLAAGADPAGAWVPDRPPSDDVAAVLAEHGVGEPDPADED